MKITFYRYGSICEPDIIRAFKNAGYIVTEYGLEITEKEHTASELVPLFSQFVMDHPCDIIFSINFFPFVSEIAKIMHIPYLSWTVDSPVMELYTSSITNPYNFTFIFDRADAEELAPLNPGHIFHLPLAANVQDKDEVIRRFDTYCKEHGCGLPADQTANCDPACGSDPSFGSCSYAGRGSGFNPRSDFKTNPAFRADSDSLWKSKM